MIKKQWLILFLTVTMLAQSACTTSAAPANPTDGCPTPTTDLKLLRNTEDGYCILYPADYSTDIPHYIVIDPITAPGDIPGNAWVTIYTEAANGRSASQIAEAAMNEVRLLSSNFNITKGEILIDGKQAIIVDGLPGPDPNRKVFVVSDDRLYTLVFMPWSPNANDPTPLENLYTTIVLTLHFIPSI